MADDEKHQPHSQRWTVFVAAPVLYVLSLGPVGWARSFLRDHLSLESFDRIGVIVRGIYAPVIWVCQHVEWIRDLLTWYISLFG